MKVPSNITVLSLILETVSTFLKVGFIIHPTKSVFVPNQEIKFLGFILNSITMTIRLPPRKVNNVKQVCENLLHEEKPTIREVAQVIGLIVSTLPGAKLGELHYRNLEKNKTVTLQTNKGNYDKIIQVRTDTMQSDPDLTITIDASKTG